MAGASTTGAGEEDRRPLKAGVALAPGEQKQTSAEPAEEVAAQSRRLRNSLLMLAVFCVIVVGLLLAVPSLRSVTDRIADASLGWVLAAVGLEVLSCVGYVVLFVFLFARLGWRLGSRLSLAELAVNAVVSVSGLGGIALGAWVLNSKGLSAERVARRSAMMWLLTSAVNVVAVLLVGVLMWLGVLPGSRDPLLTLLPAGAAIVVIAATVAIATWAQRFAARISSYHPRTAVVFGTIGGAVWDSLRLLRHPDVRLLGALGYWLFDNLVLYACLRAFGHAPSFWAVAMAYLVGMLANSIPVPGGFVAVEGGLVGMLVLFGVHDSVALAAVLTYRAIALWIPSLIGSFAFLSIRKEIGEPLHLQPQGGG